MSGEDAACTLRKKLLNCTCQDTKVFQWGHTIKVFMPSVKFLKSRARVKEFPRTVMLCLDSEGVGHFLNAIGRCVD